MLHSLKFGAYAVGFLVWTEFWLVFYRLTGVRHIRRRLMKTPRQVRRVPFN